MQEFFRSGERKAGVVTLLMACVMMAGWIKSFDVDCLIGYAQFSINSIHGGLIFEYPVETSSAQSREFLFLSRSLKKYPFLFPVFEQSMPDDKWRWQLAGFVVAEDLCTITDSSGSVIIESNRFYRIPYYSAVIPLTLVSAWLLLGRPRLAVTVPTWPI